MISLLYSIRHTDTPVKPLCSIDPSLYDSPATSITHITVDCDRAVAAIRCDCVEPTRSGARTVELGAIWHTQRHKNTLIIWFLCLQWDPKQDILSLVFKCYFPALGSWPDLCTGCPGFGWVWLGPGCQVGSAVAICVGVVLVSGSGPSEAAPVPADEPPPHCNCLTPTYTHLDCCICEDLHFIFIPKLLR